MADNNTLQTNMTRNNASISDVLRHNSQLQFLKIYVRQQTGVSSPYI
jgi:hypothetical protein